MTIVCCRTQLARRSWLQKNRNTHIPTPAIEPAHHNQLTYRFISPHLPPTRRAEDLPPSVCHDPILTGQGELTHNPTFQAMRRRSHQASFLVCRTRLAVLPPGLLAHLSEPKFASPSQFKRLPQEVVPIGSSLIIQCVIGIVEFRCFRPGSDSNVVLGQS
jgi:hypothetical protein